MFVAEIGEWNRLCQFNMPESEMFLALEWHDLAMKEDTKWAVLLKDM